MCGRADIKCKFERNELFVKNINVFMQQVKYFSQREKERRSDKKKKSLNQDPDHLRYGSGYNFSL
jgi:hypothetical protein